jgi:hypothetical protein
MFIKGVKRERKRKRERERGKKRKRKNGLQKAFFSLGSRITSGKVCCNSEPRQQTY